MQKSKSKSSKKLAKRSTDKSTKLKPTVKKAKVSSKKVSHKEAIRGRPAIRRGTSIFPIPRIPKPNPKNNKK